MNEDDEALENAGNMNDRFNLVLLKLKKDKGKNDKKELDKLIKAYPDNEIFEQRIVYRLEKRRFIDQTKIKGHENEIGDWVLDEPLKPIEKWTNQAGEQALNSNLFPSEIRQKSLNKRFRYLQIVGIGIAALGGLITIGTFLYKLIKCFLQ